MKRFITVLMLVLAVAAAMPVLAQDKVDSKIRFSDLYGEVSIRPDSEEDDAYEFAELDSVIYVNDRIRTKEESGAILGLEDMSTFVMKPESILVIHAEENNTTKMEMLAGRIMGNIKKMSEGKSLGFEMSQCVAGIKGTFVDLYQSEDGSINEVKCGRGSIEVTINGTGESVQVPAGQMLVIKEGKVATQTINVEEELSAFQKEYEKASEKLNDDDLIQKLNDKSSSIKGSLREYQDKYKAIKESLSENNSASNIQSAKAEMQKLKLGLERFGGEIHDETGAILVAANNRVEDKETSAEVKKQILTIIANFEKMFKEHQDLLKNIQSLDSEIEKLESESKSATDEQTKKNSTEESKAEELVSKIETIRSEAKEVIEDTPDKSSFSSFKESSEKLTQYLSDLEAFASEIEAFGKEGGSDKEKTEINSNYNSTHKYIEDAMRKFSSVPEIANDTIKNMNDIEDIIPDYASKVREYLSEYNAIEKSSVDAKKRYVTSVSKLIVSYDRTKRQYTKAERMYSNVVRDFARSNYQTSEYTEVEESWTRIKEAMDALDNEAGELSSCVEKIKDQLEQMLGQ